MVTSFYAVDTVNRIASVDNRNAQSHYKRITKGNVKFAIRVSDHHTVLATWILSNANLPESKNITIVFLDDMTNPSVEDSRISYTEFNSEKWRVAFPDVNKENFEVTAFVYDCNMINPDDVLIIANQLRNFIDGYSSNFSDPLYDERDKKAKKFQLISNRRPKDITENAHNSSFEDYIYNIVMSMYFPDEFENPDTTDNVKNIQESYMAVGPYQSNNGLVTIKPSDIINLYN